MGENLIKGKYKNIKGGIFMKKKLWIIGAIIVVVICVIVVIATRPKPGTYRISVGTKNGIKNMKLEDEDIVDLEKTFVNKRDTMTDKKTGETIVQETQVVTYELTAKKKGETTLTLEYEDYKTGETKKDVYNIKVDNKLKITVD